MPLSNRTLVPSVKLAARHVRLNAMPLLSCHTLHHVHHPTHQMASMTTTTITTRVLSTTSIPFSQFKRGPPRFQMGPPSGFLSHFWSAIPDGAKTALAVVGGCATLMVIGPLFFFVAPPLFVGGFFVVTRRLRKREKEMSLRWEKLKNSSLVYKGNEVDAEKLERFVQQRLVEAIEANECEITKSLGLEMAETSVALTPAESVDQDIRVSRDVMGGGALHSITVISYGLVDRKSTGSFNRLATVLVTLKPRVLTDLVQINAEPSQDCVIEVLPLMPFKSPVVIDTPSAGNWASSGRTINLKAKRTQRIR